MAKKLSPLSATDRGLVACFVAFAITSWLFEPYLVLRLDLRAFPALSDLRPAARLAAGEPHLLAYEAAGALWRWYSLHDPVFFDCPAWLEIMCAIDWVGFGSFYLYAIWAVLRRDERFRTPAIVYSACMIYSCVVYFAWELVASHPSTSMLVVFLVNGPYAVMPVVLLHRCTRGDGPLWPQQRAGKRKGA